jgi:hypothetical protein
MNLPFDLQRLAPFIAVAVLAMAGLFVVTRGVGGGGGSSGGTDANVVAQKAFSENPKTVMLSVKAVVTVEGAGARSFSFAAAGPVEESGPGKIDKADLQIDESAGARKTSLRLVSTGDRGFMKTGGRWYELSDRQYKNLFAGRGAGGTFVSDLGFDVAKWMRNPKVDGTGRVDGDEVQVLSGELDSAAMAADVKRLDSGALDSFLQQAQSGGRVTVFVGKADGIVRKIEVTGAYTGKKAARATVRFDVALTAVNQAQKIEAPGSALPSRRIRAIDRKALVARVEALSAGGGGETKTNPGTSTGTKPKSSALSGQAYINCVAQAQNGAALEQCQALVP